MELGGHHPQSADDAELHAPAALPQVRGALLQGVVPHGPGGAALVPGGAAVGSVLLLAALRRQVLPGEGCQGGRVAGMGKVTFGMIYHSGNSGLVWLRLGFFQFDLFMLYSTESSLLRSTRVLTLGCYKHVS